MVVRHKKLWLGLVIFGIGWACLKIFASLSDSLDDVVTLVFLVLVLTYSSIVAWEERQERKADRSA